MKPPSLRKLLEATDAETLLAQFSRLADGPVTLVVFDRRGRLLIDRPAGQGSHLTGMAAQVCRSGQPLASDNCQAMPLLADGQPIGALVGGPASVSGLEDALAGVFSVLSVLLAQAVERKALAQELLDRYREINLLYRLHETIGTHIDLSQVADDALAESVHIVKADGGALFLRDQVTEQLELLIAKGHTPGLDPSHGILQWVNQECRPATVNDAPRDSRHAIGDPELRSVLCVPLKVHDKILGILCLCNKRDGHIFTASDEKLIVALASQTAVAIESAQQVAARERLLREQIQELRIEIDQVRKQQAVRKIVDSDYFRRLADTAQQWREDFERE